MSAKDRARIQLRVVRVVYRGESRRIAGRGLAAEAQEGALGDLRQRSLELLDVLRSSLDGSNAWHAEILAAVAELEREIRN
jgi:hypothetical protein